MRKSIYIVSLIFILLLAIISIYFLIPVKSKHNLNLPSKNNSQIINYLKKENYDVCFLDELFLSIFTKPQKGFLYIDKKELPRYKFLIEVGSHNNHYTPITIIPGETTYFVLKMLSNKLNMNINKLKLNYKQLAPLKEGNFLANTYNIPVYFSEKDTIKFLIAKSYKKYKELSLKYFNKYNLKLWKKILLIASIIQKEAANKKEMPLISSVIFNRLHKKMRLQMDGTLNYGIYSHTKITPNRIKNDKSSYNTYKHKGLPNNPICNVSISAIIATIFPKKSKYLYFMKNSKGTHNFSVEYKKHIKNIKDRKKSLKK